MRCEYTSDLVLASIREILFGLIAKRRLILFHMCRVEKRMEQVQKRDFTFLYVITPVVALVSLTISFTVNNTQPNEFKFRHIFT